MSEDRSDFFIKASELADRLEDTNLRIVDGSWYLPAMGRDGNVEFDAVRIPGAQYFDINAVADTSLDLPHMLPSPEVFAEAAGAMGICEDNEIVVYDGPGIFSSARVWWTFWIMGAKNVRILAGGFDGWKNAGFPVETSRAQPPGAAIFHANFNPDLVRDADFLLGNVKKGETLVLDARPFGRFTGKEAEPREGLRSGHIPGSKSLPAMNVIKDGRLLPIDQLRSAFDAVGALEAASITTSCGSGVTAAILSLALETLGHKSHSLYDGSWADWGARSDVPVARWE